MIKKKLGKGLADIGLTALLSDIHADQVVTRTVQPSAQPDYPQLPTHCLQPSRLQPRQHFDEDALAELAASISSQGILQPLIVRPLTAHQYEIIAGERRWRAAQLAGLTQVPVLIRQISDQDAMAVALVENLQRRDLNALEEAEALQRLLAEFNLTHQAIAQAIGKSRTAISNLLRLLNLAPPVKTLLHTNQLEMGHARALLALNIEEQPSAAQYIVSKQLSVRATEEHVRQLLTPKAVAVPTTTALSPSLLADINDLQRQLTSQLMTKVIIKSKTHGKGKLVIHYNNITKLHSIIDRIKANT